MIFSYGFLEDDLDDARQLFLDLDIPDDDPLKPAKRAVCDDPPGVRIYSVPETSGVEWESGFVWWACVNEEDGLEFRVLQSNDGERELKVFWKETEILSSGQLLKALKEDPMWDVFQLRAAMIIQERIDTQLSILQESQLALQTSEKGQGMNEKISQGTWDTVMKLRELEGDFLIRATQASEAKVRQWLLPLGYLNRLFPTSNPYPTVPSSGFDQSCRILTADYSRKPTCWSLLQSKLTWVFMHLAQTSRRTSPEVFSLGSRIPLTVYVLRTRKLSRSLFRRAPRPHCPQDGQLPTTARQRVPRSQTEIWGPVFQVCISNICVAIACLVYW